MATEFKRQRQLTATDAEWTATDPELLEGEIAFSSDRLDFKIGPGLWSAIPYFIETMVDGTYVRLDGDVMTGDLEFQFSGRAIAMGDISTKSQLLMTTTTEYVGLVPRNNANSAWGFTDKLAYGTGDNGSRGWFVGDHTTDDDKLLTRLEMDARYAELAGANFTGEVNIKNFLDVEAAAAGENTFIRYYDFEGDQTALLIYDATNEFFRIVSRDGAGQNGRQFDFPNAVQALSDQSVLRRIDADGRYTLKVEGSSITAGDTFPVGADDNALHYMTGGPAPGLYVYYDDGNSKQWVQTNGGAGGATQEYSLTPLWTGDLPAAAATVSLSSSIANFDAVYITGFYNNSPDGAQYAWLHDRKDLQRIKTPQFATAVAVGTDWTQYRFPDDTTFEVVAGGRNIHVGAIYGVTYASGPTEIIPSRVETFHDPTGRASWSLIGDRLECWGVDVTGSGNPGLTVNFPKTFARKPSVTTASEPPGSGNNWGVTLSLPTTTTQAFLRVFGTASGTTQAGATVHWRAVGEWDGVS